MTASSITSRHGRRLISTAVAVLLSTAGLASTAGAATAAAPDRSPTATGQASRALEAGRYIVTFADEPAATYEGGIPGYPRTRPDTGKKVDPTRPEVVRYRARLAKVHDDALARVGAVKLYDYSVVTNGVLTELSAGQARTLSSTSGVRLERDAIRTLDTTSTPEYLGLTAPGGIWEQAGGAKQAGKGVIVGVIDSGIWPESPSFAGAALKRDKAGQPVEATGLRGTWFGQCVQGEQWSSQTCNDKLIGARFYVAGFGKQNIAKEEYLSPRDGGGHGSHTASTAAGNVVDGVTIDGFTQGDGTASGMAPGADVAAYKVCWEAKPGASAGCFNGDSVAAIDDAVADGVDVINYSVGGSSESSPLDSVEQAYRRAANVGVFVANSAGNSGPDASTLDHPSPWLTTVAASTSRVSEQAVRLGNGAEYVGSSITSGLAATPLVTSVSVKTAAASAADAALCFPGTLDPAKAADKVVQCDRGVNARIEKGFEVKRAGGAGLVLTNTSANSLNSDFHPVPAVHVDEVARAAILAYITSAGTGATAAIVAGSSGTQIPEVAAFSSRGPSTTTGGDILKPDISAPGVDVLAAVAPPSNYGRSWDYYSGTSMSSPHIAGIGALLKAAHPTWSPAEVKSAMMTTAKDHASAASSDPFAQGAGFVQPSSALDPGLVFPAGPDDYRSYMVGLGVQFASPFHTLPAVDGSDLNQASLAIGALAGRQTVTRTVKNASTTQEAYRVEESVAGMTITASPASFTLAPGASQTISLTVTREDTAAIGSWAKGSLSLVGSAHTVRIPVAVKPVAIAAPTEISGSGVSGSTTYSVVSGFTGQLVPTVTGLVGATATAGIVTSGAFSPAASAATQVYTLEVAAGTALVRFDVDAASDADDLDLYVYKDGAEIALSASAAGDEQVSLPEPEAGTYTVYVNGYDTGGGGAYAYTQWAVPPVDAGNLVVTGGGPVTVAQSVPLTATWSGLTAGLRYLGVIGYEGATETTVVTIG